MCLSVYFFLNSYIVAIKKEMITQIGLGSLQPQETKLIYTTIHF